jgi:hypothetical protein
MRVHDLIQIEKKWVSNCFVTVHVIEDRLIVGVFSRFSILSFPLQSLFFQVTQLMPGKHKHQSKYTEFYPHTHGLPFSVNSSQFADYATPTMPWAAALVQWIERAPPKSRNAIVGFGFISSAIH